MKTRLKLYLAWSLASVACACLGGDGYYTEFAWGQDYVQELASGTSSRPAAECTTNGAFDPTDSKTYQFASIPEPVIRRRMLDVVNKTNLCLPWMCNVGDITKADAFVPFTLNTGDYTNGFAPRRAWEFYWNSASGTVYGLEWENTNVAPYTSLTNIVATTNVVRVYVPYGGAVTGPVFQVWRTNVNVVSNWCAEIHGLSSTAEATANGVAIDHDGNVITVGQFRGTVNLGDGVIHTNAGGGSSYDLFIAKYSSAGTLQWATNFGGTDVDWATAVAVDSANNIYVTGKITYNDTVSNIDLGCGPILGTNGPDNQGFGKADEFVAKYSPLGVCTWAKVFGGNAIDDGRGIAVDSDDNIIVGGNTSGATFNYGCGAMNFTLTADFTLAKLASSNAACIWSKRFGGEKNDTIKQVMVDTNKDVYITGYFSTTANFGGTNVAPVGTYGAFVAKYSGVDGTYLWSRTFGGSGSATAWAVVADPRNSDVVVTGTCGNGTDPGGGVINNGGGSSMFVVKYNPAGVFQWQTNYGGNVNAFDYAKAVAIDSNGVVNITGRFMSAVTFNGIDWYWGNGLMNYYLLSLTSAGAYRWAEKCETTASQGTGMAVDPSGNIYTVGEWQQLGTFGGVTVNASPSGMGAFTARTKYR